MMRLWGLEMIMLGELRALSRKLEMARSAYHYRDSRFTLTAIRRSHFLRLEVEPSASWPKKSSRPPNVIQSSIHPSSLPRHPKRSQLPPIPS